MQQVLRRLGAPSEQQVREMAKSPLVTDTLVPAVRNYTLPNRIRPGALPDGVFGETFPNTSEVYINTGRANWLQQGDTPAGTRNLRNTVLHEAAHTATDPRADFPEYFSVQRPDLWFSGDGETVYRGKPGQGASTKSEALNLRTRRVTGDHARSGMFPKASPAEVQAFRDLDPYYREGREVRFGGGTTDYDGESFAQAFTNAMGFLSDNASGVQPNYRERIGRLEANTPGAGQIVRDLLNKPVYAKHPLKSVIR